MASINDRPGNGNPTNEASGEETGTGANAEETAHATEGLEATVTTSDAAEDREATTDRMGGAMPHLEQNAGEPADEDTPTSGVPVFAALASLRAFLDEHGASPEIESALSKLDDAVRRRGAELTDGGEGSPPASGRRRTDGGDNEHTPTSRTLPPSLSTMALRLNDGAMLVSLEDADDRDLSGREVIRCLVLAKEEAASAYKTLDGPISDAVANIIGHLPKSAS